MQLPNINSTNIYIIILLIINKHQTNYLTVKERIEKGSTVPTPTVEH